MTLRTLTEADLLQILAWRNSPQVRMSMYSKHEISEIEHRTWFARIQGDPTSRWYMHEDEHGGADGVVYFTDLSIENRSSFWGFYASPEAPVGTGTKLGLDALDEAFIRLGLHKLNGEVLATNQASLRFHKKLGFQQEGRFRDFYLDGAVYVDVIRFGIIASEWATKRFEVFQKAGVSQCNSTACIPESIGTKS